MSIDTSLLAFAGLALAMTLVPGADTVFVIRASLRGGRTAGIVAGLGVALGVIVWGGLTGLGVALLLVRFPLAYTIVAVAGGLYLVLLAARSLRSSWRMWHDEADAADLGAGGRQSLGAVFWVGLLTNLLNPKIGVFYLSVIPGLFAGQELSAWLGMLLGGIHALWGVLWLSLIAVLANWARMRLMHPRTRATMEAVCGLLLLGFGVFVIVGVISQAL